MIRAALCQSCLCVRPMDTDITHELTCDNGNCRAQMCHCASCMRSWAKLAAGERDARNLNVASRVYIASWNPSTGAVFKK